MGNTKKEQPTSSFPSRLLSERNRRGWSQVRLAEELGIDTKTVSRWERGQVTPAAYLREKLCVLLALSPQELGLLETLEVVPVVSPLLFDPAIPLLPAIPLVGRDDQISLLRQRLRSGSKSVLSALNGLPGVGKTALSVALARDPELHEHFRDGILWAGLGPKPDILGHLRRWGAWLGMSSEEMRDLKDIEAWSLALHHAIGSRTMLLVIDDVWKASDVLSFKIGGPTCAHLITTRFSSIAAEIATDGAVTIEELTSEEGVALLQTLAPQVVEQEPQRVRELVEAVGGLPLALHLIGNYLQRQFYRSNPRRMAQALQLLSDASARLDLQETRSSAELHSSYPRSALISLRSTIAVTDQQLHEQVRHALYALAVFPAKPNSFSKEAALAVADCSTEVLDMLTDTGLLQINEANRYMLHPTIANYAYLQLKQGMNFDQAHQRLIAYLTSFVETHSTDYQVLERENANILAALDAAFTQNGLAELPRLACAFTPFLISHGLFSLAEHHLQRAYQATNSLNDISVRINVLATLEEVLQRQGQAERQLSHIRASIATFPLFAIARLSLEEDEKALIGKIYSVYAGVSRSKSEGFEGESFDIAGVDTHESLSLDILLHADKNIKLTSERLKLLQYDLRYLESQLVKFTIQAVAPGHCAFDIHFYHERRWLTTIQIEFEALEKPQMVAVSSEE